MEKFGAVGLRAELAKTPPGYSMDFTDTKTGETWTVVRKAEFEELMQRLETCDGEDPDTEGLPGREPQR